MGERDAAMAHQQVLHMAEEWRLKEAQAQQGPHQPWSMISNHSSRNRHPTPVGSRPSSAPINYYDFQQPAMQYSPQPVANPARAQSAGKARKPGAKIAMSESERQARYPGIQPKNLPPKKPTAPYARPEVDAPAVPVDPKDVRARQIQYYQKHIKPPPKPQVKLTPHNHQRPPDKFGMLVDDLMYGDVQPLRQAMREQHARKR